MAETESQGDAKKFEEIVLNKSLADISEEDKSRAEELKNKANDFFKGL